MAIYIQNIVRMKYIKKFETEAEFEAYKNGEDFITPNVTYITSTKKVFTFNHVRFEVSDGEFEVTDGIFTVLQ